MFHINHLIFFIGLFFPCLNIEIYRSCYEALLNEKVSSGIFQIQPFFQSNVANISCQVLNDTIGLATLDHNAENETFVNGYESKYSYRKVIQYENFDEKESDAFLKTTADCSQGMTYISHASTSEDHGALFWDNLFVKAGNSKDGICKCLITFNCINTSSSSSSCANTNTKNIITEEGLFSVKPSRLPIKEIFFGDTGESHEWVRYRIWKLNCTLKLMNVILKFPTKLYDCLTNNPFVAQYELMDGNKDSCIKYETKTVYLEIETLSNVTKFQVFGKDLDQNNVQVVLYDKKMETCHKNLNFVYNCKPSKFMILKAFSSEASSIELCEIDIFV